MDIDSFGPHYNRIVLDVCLHVEGKYNWTTALEFHNFWPISRLDALFKNLLDILKINSTNVCTEFTIPASMFKKNIYEKGETGYPI